MNHLGTKKIRNLPLLPSLLATTILASSGCALPQYEEAVELDTDEYSDIVFGSTTTQPVEANDDDGLPVELFFVVESELEVVERSIIDPNVNDVLTAVAGTPLEAEIAEFEGLDTALAPDFKPVARGRAGESQIVVIDVEGNGLRTVARDQPPQARLIASQMVCTLTDLTLKTAPITGVQFFDSDGEIRINNADGEPIQDGAARRSDFDDCKTGTEKALEAAESAEQEEE